MQFIINVMNTKNLPFILARFSLFLVYFWFGILKVLGTSPANPLVAGLLEKTLPFITFDQFIIIFGIFEMVIGVLFLLPGMDRLTLVFFVLHILTTVMPLFLVATMTWNSFLVPTLEGQYIIKNAVLISLVVFVLHPNIHMLKLRKA